MRHWLSNEFFTTIAANLPLSSPYHAARVNVSRNAFFSSRSENTESFFDVDTVVKTKWNMVYGGLYSFQQQVRLITIFLNIFSYFFCMLSEFAKVFALIIIHGFWKESLTRTDR